MYVCTHANHIILVNIVKRGKLRQKTNYKIWFQSDHKYIYMHISIPEKCFETISWPLSEKGTLQCGSLDT